MKQFLIITVAFILTLINNSYAQNDNRIPAKGLAVFSADGQFKPYGFTRHAIGDNDIQIEILYAGICHSDLHNPTIAIHWLPLFLKCFEMLE